MKRNLTNTIIPIVFALVLAFSLRGLPGAPAVEELLSDKWHQYGPFELSPERGRFALTYSLVEDRSFQFSVPLARFVLPDLGYVNGQYVSLFAPGVSFLLIPAFVIGKLTQATQIATYATIAAVALVNALLVRSIAGRLGAHSLAAWLGALTFLFATPAFAYAVSLYQHHVSVLAMLLSLYLLVNWHQRWSPLVIWFLIASAISVDYPNLLLMLPFGFLCLVKLIRIRKLKSQLMININFIGLWALLIMVLPLAFFAWTNQRSYGHPLKLSGSIENVRGIDAEGLPERLPDQAPMNSTTTQEATSARPILGFFQTRNLARGLLVHTISLERGVLVFTPVLLVGLWGASLLSKSHPRILACMIAVIGMNLILYSLWGDPWGGWAFGSRYLIPGYAMLSILVAVFLSEKRRSRLFLVMFMLILVYSIAVNTLGAITTNRVPPKGEAQMLEARYGHKVPYTYLRNWLQLTTAGSTSLVYRVFLNQFIDPKIYFGILVTLLTGTAGIAILKLHRAHSAKEEWKDE